jgi:hypothetical protein
MDTIVSALERIWQGPLESEIDKTLVYGEENVIRSKRFHAICFPFNKKEVNVLISLSRSCGYAEYGLKYTKCCTEIICPLSAVDIRFASYSSHIHCTSGGGAGLQEPRPKRLLATRPFSSSACLPLLHILFSDHACICSKFCEYKCFAKKKREAKFVFFSVKLLKMLVY